MPSAPASPGPGPDEDSGLDEDEPPGPDEEYDDPEHPAMPWDLDLTAIGAETDELAATDAADTGILARQGLLAGLAAAEARTRGRRGPGQPGSARRVPGRSGSPAGGFGAGQPLDVAPGGSALLGFAEPVADDEERLGNAALAGRELPPAEVLAADQRITWWARQLKAAGLAGTMDELRARAYLDLLLDKDSRPAQSGGGAADGTTGEDSNGTGVEDSNGTSGRDDRGNGGSRAPAPPEPRTPPGSGVLPAGFTGRNHLTVPLATLLELADRPGELSGLGPVDPALARDLARASAASPKTTWCLTVTDAEGYAIGHGCARPEPRNQRKRQFGRRGGHDPPGFTFTAAGADGPPGGYGSWRFATGTPGQPALLIAIDPIAIDTCDHRFAAAGHDPGVKLRHLSQVRHALCTGPMCRRPSARADFEHNIPYEEGGRSCLCNGGPKCRHEHRLKQDPSWTVEQPTPATFRWTTPSGRQYTTEPTRYPI